jgi:hypothetical protein
MLRRGRATPLLLGWRSSFLTGSIFLGMHADSCYVLFNKSSVNSKQVYPCAVSFHVLLSLVLHLAVSNFFNLIPTIYCRIGTKVGGIGWSDPPEVLSSRQS